MTNRLSTWASIDESLTKTAAWDSIWKQHFKEYQKDLRHAYYIAAVRRRQERRMLEIAAGSFRDMSALNRWGYFCEGLDFSAESVTKARQIFPPFSDRIKKMDAASMDYSDRAFDLTFHNGLWGYFKDEQISVLAEEQARVTAQRMIAIVHNAHNSAFKEKFAVWSQEDPLYRIRFFCADEIMNLMHPFCRHVSILPVGGGRMDRLINRGFGPNVFRWVYAIYGRFENLETSERLMVIGQVAL